MTLILLNIALFFISFFLTLYLRRIFTQPKNNKKADNNQSSIQPLSQQQQQQQQRMPQVNAARTVDTRNASNTSATKPDDKQEKRKSEPLSNKKTSHFENAVLELAKETQYPIRSMQTFDAKNTLTTMLAMSTTRKNCYPHLNYTILAKMKLSVTQLREEYNANLVALIAKFGTHHFYKDMFHLFLCDKLKADLRICSEHLDQKESHRCITAFYVTIVRSCNNSLSLTHLARSKLYEKFWVHLIDYKKLRECSLGIAQYLNCTRTKGFRSEIARHEAYIDQIYYIGLSEIAHHEAYIIPTIIELAITDSRQYALLKNRSVIFEYISKQDQSTAKKLLQLIPKNLEIQEHLLKEYYLDRHNINALELRNTYGFNTKIILKHHGIENSILHGLNPFKLIKDKYCSVDALKAIIKAHPAVSPLALLTSHHLSITDLINPIGKYTFNIQTLLSIGFRAEDFKYGLIHHDSTPVTNRNSKIPYMSLLQYLYQKTQNNDPSFWVGIKKQRLNNVFNQKTTPDHHKAQVEYWKRHPHTIMRSHHIKPERKSDIVKDIFKVSNVHPTLFINLNQIQLAIRDLTSCADIDPIAKLLKLLKMSRLITVLSRVHSISGNNKFISALKNELNNYERFLIETCQNSSYQFADKIHTLLTNLPSGCSNISQPAAKILQSLTMEPSIKYFEPSKLISLAKKEHSKMLNVKCIVTPNRSWTSSRLIDPQFFVSTRKKYVGLSKAGKTDVLFIVNSIATGKCREPKWFHRAPAEVLSGIFDSESIIAGGNKDSKVAAKGYQGAFLSSSLTDPRSKSYGEFVFAFDQQAADRSAQINRNGHLPAKTKEDSQSEYQASKAHGAVWHGQKKDIEFNSLSCIGIPEDFIEKGQAYNGDIVLKQSLSKKNTLINIDGRSYLKLSGHCEKLVPIVRTLALEYVFDLLRFTRIKHSIPKKQQKETIPPFAPIQSSMLSGSSLENRSLNHPPIAEENNQLTLQKRLMLFQEGISPPYSNLRVSTSRP